MEFKIGKTYRYKDTLEIRELEELFVIDVLSKKFILCGYDGNDRLKLRDTKTFFIQSVTKEHAEKILEEVDVIGSL